jgi:3-methyladenine DNA glycosylase AlkD
MEKLIQDIKSALHEFFDPKRLELSKTYYPTQMEVIGVTVPNVKKVVKEVKKQTKKYTPTEKLALAIALLEEDIFECQQIAYEYIKTNKDVLTMLSEEDVYDLGRNLDNWVSVDTYSVYIMGYAWRENVITIDKIKDLMQSEDVWMRRVAVVSTVALNLKSQGGTRDVLQTLEICRLAVDDHEDMVVKALSWALRELSKVSKEAVVEFINQYQSQLAKRVLREVKNKLETGKKNLTPVTCSRIR